MDPYDSTGYIHGLRSGLCEEAGMERVLWILAVSEPFFPFEVSGALSVAVWGGF